MTWMQTASGKKFDLLRPRPEDVDFDDIATHLGNIVRFTGAAGKLSVAQHCCMGADALLDETSDVYLALLFLLHDAKEFVLNDPSTPMKWAQIQFLARLLGVDAGKIRRGLNFFESRIDDAIFVAAGIPGYDEERWHLVKWMDERMCLTERAHLMGPPPEPWHPSIEDAEPVRMLGKIQIWPPEKAREEWLSRFKQWRPKAEAAE